MSEEKKLEPTEEQAAIIESAQLDESFMAVAGAGSAKTTTLKMMAPGLRNQKVLAVAFNKRIVSDLVEALPENFTVKTLNGLGHGAWMRQRGGKLELDASKLVPIVKKVLDEKAPDIRREDADGSCFNAIRKFTSTMRKNNWVPRGAMNRAPRFIGPSPTEYIDEFMISEDWSTGLMPVGRLIELSEEALLWSIAQAFNKVIDFDDQIYMTTSFFAPYEQYDTVLVDEAQDLSPANHLQLIQCKPRQLIAVGDPKQAIYGFRGADHNSMANLQRLAKERLDIDLKIFPLATSFRCPKAVAARQAAHYPEFKAFEANPEGVVETLGSWSISDLLPDSAVICRNNAPLVSLAFKLLQSKRGFTFFGLDMAKNLKGLIKKVAGFSGKDLRQADKAIPRDHLLTQLSLWYEREASKLNEKNKGELLAALKDRRECARMIIGETETLGQAIELCDTIFDSKGPGLTLTSGHRSKGFEWSTVYHLDPHRLPSKFALMQAQAGYPAQLLQERNLLYVIETRTKHSLFMITLEGNSDGAESVEE
jgi:DNA helicase II / ATP-dependent DNA helicase PcrA